MSDNLKFNKLIPELSVTDINVSIKFYTNLGFKIIYKRPENKFYFLELEGNQLMIEQINNNWNTGTLEYPFGRGINISMTIKDVEVFYNKIKQLNYKIYKELTTSEYRVDSTIYKDKEFLIQDPDGYLLRFNN